MPFTLPFFSPLNLNAPFQKCTEALLWILRVMFPLSLDKSLWLGEEFVNSI
jgi:hypothetical protein